MRAFMFLAACAISFAASHAEAEARCDIARPIVFAGIDYDSARFHNSLAQRILTDGYGCKTDQIPGQVIPLLTGLARGDVDVVMEVWTANPAQAWLDGRKTGRTVSLGVNFPDAREAWYVPRYLVEGAGAPAPDLRSVRDLPRYAKLFEDPEEPGKGRFLNCPAGWQCEVVNSKKLAAYGLADSFTNFRAGTGEAMAAAIESAVKRKRPILFYYWGPTWLLGKYDFVALEEPPFDPTVWSELMRSDDPTRATAYPSSDVIIGANRAFVEQAPTVAGFLRNYETTSRDVSEALAYMRDHDVQPAEAARWFLETRQAVWTKWVPAEVAARVKARL